MRALIVTAGLLVTAGIAWAAAPQPTTIVHTPAPVNALAQDGGWLGWLAGDGKKCNDVHLMGGPTTYVLPQPPNSGMTCHWALSSGAVHLAIAADAAAALWTLHERNSDFVMTAQVGGREVEADRLAHPSGTGWWLGAVAGGGTTLAYSAIDVEYVNPLGCGSGGSCKKKIAGGRVYLVTAGQKTPLAGAGAARALAISNGRIAYFRATTVAKGGIPEANAGVAVQVEDISKGTIVSRARPVGVPVAVALSPHVLAVLTRKADKVRLSWFDATTGHKLGSVGVSGQTAPMLAMNDQFIVYRFGRTIRALVLAHHRSHLLGKMATQHLGLSLDDGRLVWAENRRSSGLIRALSVH